MATIIDARGQNRSSTAGKERRVDFTMSTKQAPIPAYISPIYKPRQQEEFARTLSVPHRSRQTRRNNYQPDGREKLSVPGYNGAYISGISGELGI